MSVNSNTVKKYNLNVAGNPSYSKTEKPSDIIDEVVDNLPLTHLVVNAHGFMIGGRARIDLGAGFDPVGNPDLWDNLADQVRYIWFTNCLIGHDDAFLQDIANRTKAWVMAYAMGCSASKTLP